MNSPTTLKTIIKAQKAQNKLDNDNLKLAESLLKQERLTLKAQQRVSLFAMSNQAPKFSSATKLPVNPMD